MIRGKITAEEFREIRAAAEDHEDLIEALQALGFDTSEIPPEPVYDGPPTPWSELVSTTLKARSPQLVASLTRNNALLQRLMDKKPA